MTQQQQQQPTHCSSIREGEGDHQWNPEHPLEDADADESKIIVLLEIIHRLLEPNHNSYM